MITGRAFTGGGAGAWAGIFWVELTGFGFLSIAPIEAQGEFVIRIRPSLVQRYVSA